MGRQTGNLKATRGGKMNGTHLLITALALFSMFFGAGNLIFPPMMGAQAGDNFAPAILGFVLGGVLLPVVTIIAVAVSGSDVRSLSSRAGKGFGLVFSMVTYLSIGAFYGLPRTGAVGFSIAFSPITGWTSKSEEIIFNLVFFGIAFAAAANPNVMVERLGRILTPALLTLLAVLVWGSFTNLKYTPRPAQGVYANETLSQGFLAGYMTMDSVAALAFGIIVVSAFKYRGVSDRSSLVKNAAGASFIAGGLLALIYVGLGLVGRMMPGALEYKNGALLLSDASALVLGRTGQIIFGFIVLLACMTTAIGLLVASGEFFTRLFPKISYRPWVAIFALVSFIFSSNGLDMILKISGPVIGLIYPVAIAVVFAALADKFLLAGRVHGRAAFCGAVWMATLWSALMFISERLVWVDAIISWSPLHDKQLGWVFPAVLAYVAGLCFDVFRGDKSLSGNKSTSQNIHLSPSGE